MLTRKTASAAALMAAGVLLLSACTYPGPNPAKFGYRKAQGGGIVVAYPLCPGDTVYGAKISVRVNERDFDFKTLWQAEEPASKRVEAGTFSVGTGESFHMVKRALKGKPPSGFYVEVVEIRDGKQVDGRDGWIDLKRLTSASLKSDEFMTHEGEVMTRHQIDAQLNCHSSSPKA